MNILCIGDVVGSIGCEFLRSKLSVLKRIEGIDAVIVNGENSADGNGITPVSAKHILDSGADIITGGNHSFRRPEMHTVLDESDCIIRPANYPEGTYGKGYTIIDLGFTRIGVINILGVVYTESLDCPFKTADSIIEKLKNDGIKNILIDIHAEATAEKKALAYHLDGRVSAVFGTHTHTQTADEQILPNGTGFITDLGMVGPTDSVLGVKSELAIKKMKDKLPVRFAIADGKCHLDGCIFTIDVKTAKCTCVERIHIE
ncbi:MAG: TIGR00282 family metallophosphoesterase [Clostridia bacterium]|nr:TIGR00282 family metallophosphoesterase [Clostridia bacterium]